MMKMKRCLIVTGGTIDIAFAKDFLSQRSYDYVIAADAGLEVLRPLHISPNAVVGDLGDVDQAVHTGDDLGEGAFDGGAPGL